MPTIYLERLSKIIFLLLLGASVARGVVLSWHWVLIHDAMVVHYIGLMLTEGVLPYRDIFDMNFPLTYWIHAFCIEVLGKSDSATRSFDLLWCYAGAASIAATLWRRDLSIAISAALVYALVHFSNGYMNQLQRDFYMVPMLVMSAYYLEKKSFRAYFIAGLCAGAAASIKPTAALFILCMGIYLFARYRGAFKPVIWLAAGTFIMPAISFAWMGYMGVLHDFLDITWNFTLPLYARPNFDRTFHFNYQPVFLAVGIILTMAALYKRSILQPTILLPVIGMAYGLFHYYAQGKAYAQHLYPFWAFFIIVVANAVMGLTKRFPRALWPGMASCVLILQMFAPEKILWQSKGFYYDTPLAFESAVLQHNLSNRFTHAEGLRIQFMEDIYGILWRVAYVNDWKPATRFLYSFIFYADPTNPVMQRYRHEFIRSMEKEEPALWLVSAHSWPQYRRVIFTSINEDKELKPWLDQNYDLVMNESALHAWLKKSLMP